MGTYIESEQSYEDSSPIEIYDISSGANRWYFTNDIETLRFGNADYIPIPIKRGETESNGDATKSNMEIRISRNTNLADLFRVTPPSEVVTITIRQYHKDYGIVNAENYLVVVWKGRIINVSWEDTEMVLTTESVFSSLLRTGVTRKFSRQCTHALYGNGCTLNKGNFSTTAVVQTVVQTTLSVPHGKAENYYAGGYLTYRNADTAAIERRAIASNTSNTITLTAPPIGMKAGVTEVTMYAGCDHSHKTCISKFNNILNYGGQPYIPIQNPFGGSTIF